MPNITTVSKIVEKHDGLTEGGVRWDIFNEDKNGLAETGAILRKGRRVRIVEELYLAWHGVPQRLLTNHDGHAAA